MNCTPSFLPYAQTGYFSKIVLDYIIQANGILPFYQHPVSIEGIMESIKSRRLFKNERSLLSSIFREQYSHLTPSSNVTYNIESLLHENTFTICTAHQPNIFTGQLYFIYKILHTIKLSAWLNENIPGCHFVPVYYMGSEDADLDELGHIFINGEKFEWKTKQTGAVGRMIVDEELLKLIEAISGQLLVQPHGEEIVKLMIDCYKEGQSIEQATFRLVDALFGEMGLLIILPDNPALKKSFIPIIERELTEKFSHPHVQQTEAQFPVDYKTQASGRELNMFYLLDNKRERIEMEDDQWIVLNTPLKFSRNELIAELNEHPERFSPNVILRPVFQEWILPNIAFVGGGGEIAYWLQLKSTFEAAGVPYPVLTVRNSFMLISKQLEVLTNKLELNQIDLFKPETDLVNYLVKRDTTVQLNIEKEKDQLSTLYEQLKITASKIDITLQNHTIALQTQSLKKIDELEKKMLRAEKKKFDAEVRQLNKIKSQLFPNNNLQERVDNLMPYYAKWGKDFIKVIFENSLSLEQQFTILSQK